MVAFSLYDFVEDGGKNVLFTNPNCHFFPTVFLFMILLSSLRTKKNSFSFDNPVLCYHYVWFLV